MKSSTDASCNSGRGGWGGGSGDASGNSGRGGWGGGSGDNTMARGGGAADRGIRERMPIQAAPPMHPIIAFLAEGGDIDVVYLAIIKKNAAFEVARGYVAAEGCFGVWFTATLAQNLPCPFYTRSTASSSRVLRCRRL